MSIEITVPGGEKRRLLTAGKYCPENIDVTAEGASFPLVVSVTTGAVVTATKGSLSVSGTASGGSVTLKLPEAGIWSVVATNNGQTSVTKTVSVVDRYETALAFVSTTLNDNEWDVIRSVSDAGEGANYWSVGDRKAVVLNGTVGVLTLSNVTIYAFIIGFNHNSSVEGSGRIHFQFGKTALSGGKDVCFVDGEHTSSGSDAGFCMNTRSTNSGGWNNSYMRKTICQAFKNALPAALKNVLKSVTKYTNNTGQSTASSAVTATTDEIFLLAEYEVFGSLHHANSNESSKQKQYTYYSAGNSKVKYKHSSTGSATRWWLRSPVASSSEIFMNVFTDGTVAYGGATDLYGFAPCFCV